MLGKWEYLFLLMILFQLSRKYWYTFKWQQKEWCTTPVIYVRVIATQLVIVNTSSIFSYTNSLAIPEHEGSVLIILPSFYNSKYYNIPIFYLSSTIADATTSQSLKHIPLIVANMLPPLGDPLSFQTNTVALGAGEFIDMDELLPDHVGITRPDDTGKASAKHHTVAGILQWIATRCKFCFSLSHGSSDCAWATDQPTS